MERKEAYAHLAEWFEYLNDDCGYENWSQYFITKLRAYPVKTGLDIGCGGGWFTRAFQRAGYHMTGVDISPEMLDFAQAQALKETEKALNEAASEATLSKEQSTIGEDMAPSPIRIKQFTDGVLELTRTEKAIFDAYIEHMSTKEVMALLNIKENTLKFHNKNLYLKLGVSSRKELQEIHKQVQAETEHRREAADVTV